MAETVQAPAHQLQALPDLRLPGRLGDVDQDPRQVEHRRHPGDHEHEVEGLGQQVGHAVAPECFNSPCPRGRWPMRLRRCRWRDPRR
ncbi:hypothetical protein SDC9_200176 [bioreactor metagenome]|uniref:Uncharacterized protein n=1 Tax=bioreactor metagenome TaxID=1076179 RepID=A0A645IVT2_9ZZZZ